MLLLGANQAGDAVEPGFGWYSLFLDQQPLAIRSVRVSSSSFAQLAPGVSLAVARRTAKECAIKALPLRCRAYSICYQQVSVGRHKITVIGR